MAERRTFIDERGVRVGDARRWSRSLRSRELVVQLLDNEGVAVDTRALQRAFPHVDIGCRTLTVVLDGVYETEGAETVQAGQIAYESRSRWHERWEGNRQRFVTLVWEVGGPDATGLERLGPRALEAWRRVADTVARGGEDVEDAVDLALSAANAHGVQPPRPSAPVPPDVLRLEEPLRQAYMRLHDNPQWVDLERSSGISERQLRRAFREHDGWFVSGSFRDSLKLYRAQVAVCLLESTDVSARRVAAALGYGSDRALYTALRRLGLGRG